MIEFAIYVQNWLDSTKYEISTSIRNCILKKGVVKVKRLNGENITIWIPKFITFKTPILPNKGNEIISRKVLDNHQLYLNIKLNFFASQW